MASNFQDSSSDDDSDVAHTMKMNCWTMFWINIDREYSKFLIS